MRRSVLFGLLVLTGLLGAALGYRLGRPRTERQIPERREVAVDTTGAGRIVDVYFTEADSDGGEIRLVAIPRRLPTEADPVPGSVLGLLEGPTASELRRGLRSQIPPGTRLLGFRMDDSVAVLNLNAQIGTGGGSASMRARVAQLVYTATQFPEVAGIEILIDGAVPEALGGEGLILERPIRRPAEPPVF